MKVAVMGLGAMGARMARRLMESGHEVTVWNRSDGPADALAAAGARRAASPAEAVADAEVALGMVRDDGASRSVWLDTEHGALRALRADAVAIESSTVTPAWVRELAGACASRRIALLDAPVLGSRGQAEAGALIHLVGGTAAALSAATPVLAALGQAAHHMGPSGAGAAAKLLVNSLLGIQVAALAELLGAAPRLGLDPRRFVAVLGETPPCSPAARAAAQGMLAHAFAPAFPIDLLEKDFAYLLVMAGQALPMSDAARSVFERAKAQGLAGKNMTAVAELYA
ncbi:NAD(P)-dependent oxidoreductase [Phenylobacterium terrae]|uniref:NAD(P)-dependent oxidoreductase n=1 Tax=Phenylobacterium terrae TaxID=2665495 RepID=A0ABW4N6W7_9CAUL